MNKTVIYLNFNKHVLGYLEEKGEGYLWTPNLEGIEGARKENDLAMDMFFLPSYQKEYSFVPRHYNEFLENWDRYDLKMKSGIIDTDSDFVKLYKLSKLNYFSQEFVIKTID